MKRIIITGVSKGLWYALAEKFLAEGYAVVGISRTKPDLAIEHIAADLTTEQWLQTSIDTIKTQHSDFVCLINNLWDGKAQKTQDIDFASADRALKVNLLAPMLLTSALMDNIKNNEADIINIGATIGFKPGEHFVAYSSAKYGLRWLTENLQTELKKTKSRVIGIHPGGMETPGNTWDGGRQDQFATISWNKANITYMNPEDIAMIVYNTFITPKYIEISEIIINRK